MLKCPCECEYIPKYVYICANIRLGLTNCKSIFTFTQVYVSENFSSCECKVICIFAHCVVVIMLVAESAFHSTVLHAVV